MNVKYKDMHIHNKIKSVNSADTYSVCGSPCRSSSYFCSSVRLVRAFSSYCRCPPTNEAEYCDGRVRLSVCLSARVGPISEPTHLNFTQFLCMLLWLWPGLGLPLVDDVMLAYDVQRRRNVGRASAVLGDINIFRLWQVYHTDRASILRLLSLIIRSLLHDFSVTGSLNFI